MSFVGDPEVISPIESRWHLLFVQYTNIHALMIDVKNFKPLKYFTLTVSLSVIFKIINLPNTTFHVIHTEIDFIWLFLNAFWTHK